MSLGAHGIMVICVVIGYSKRSDHDKDVTFHRVPAVLKHMDECDLELSKRRRDGYIVATISRENFDTDDLGKYRICSRHFSKSGKPADLRDYTDLAWLPILNLGHSKNKNQHPNLDRYERAKRRGEEQKVKKNVLQQIAEVISQETTEVVVKEEMLKLSHSLNGRVYTTGDMFSKCCQRIYCKLCE